MMSPFDSESDPVSVNGLWRHAPRGLRDKPWVVGAVVALLVVGAAVAFWPKAKAPVAADSGPVALTVTTTTPSQHKIKSSIYGNGTVVAWQELIVSAEATGLRVVDVLVEEGDDVKAGQVLAKLDNKVLGAQLRAQDARVAEARANVVVAKNNLVRAQELVRRDVMSPSTLDDRKSAYDTAVAREAAALASRDELASRVGQTNIVAPADGHISARSILIGDVINPGTKTFKLIRDNRLELDAQISETDLGGIAPDQPVTVTHEGNAPVIGTVRALAPIVDAKSRLGIVHIALPANSGLRIGMYARAEITLADASVTALPESSVVWRDDKAFVFVVAADGHVAERAIDAGARQGNWVEVRGGLKADERVVSTGAGFLHDGDRVRVNNAGVAGEAQANAAKLP